MSNNTLLYVGGAAAAYFLFLKPSTPGQAPATNVANMFNPGPAQSAPVYGINSGQVGGNGDFNTVANWAQLATMYPNLTNPNYQLTNSEIQQYLTNYQDLRQGLQTWPGGMNVAAQTHWTKYGCAEKRIFLPLTPASNVNYIPPPQNHKASGGGSFLSTALTVATTILPFILGPNDQVLNEADVRLLFTGSLILNDILPMYKQADPANVAAIYTTMDKLLNQYS